MNTMTRLKAYATAGSMVAAALLATPQPAAAQKITSDQDRTATFTNYRTYSVVRGQVPAGVSQLMVQRVEAGVRSELAALGLLAAEAGAPADLTVAYHAATKEEVSLESYNYGPRWGGGTVDVNKVLIGMLVVDVSETKGKNLLWRATATDTVSDNPQKNEKKIQKAVEKMFEKYPTASKK